GEAVRDASFLERAADPSVATSAGALGDEARRARAHAHLDAALALVPDGAAGRAAAGRCWLTLARLTAPGSPERLAAIARAREFAPSDSSLLRLLAEDLLARADVAPVLESPAPLAGYDRVLCLR